MRRFVVLLALTGAGCASQPTEIGLPPAPQLAYAHERPEDGEDFRLAPGHIAVSEDESFFVTFREVTSDSRCPADVTCVWEGDAVVLIGTAPAGGRWTWRSLHTAGDTVEVIAATHAVRLVDLDPAPISSQPIPQSMYTAVLRITRWPPEPRSARAQLVGDVGARAPEGFETTSRGSTAHSWRTATRP